MRKSWNRWGWEWRRGRFGIDVSLDLINRPSLSWDWIDGDRIWLGLNYGNGNSDPVLSLFVDELRAPRWFKRVSARRAKRADA